MEKLSLDEYHALLAHPDTTEERILEVSQIVRGTGAFDFKLIPDPALVLMSEEELREESAMGFGNFHCRWRRGRNFHKRRNRGEDLPLLVSEGDSWFQFPFLIDEVVDQLKDDYLIWSVGAAGDTLDNMVYGRRAKGEMEYLDTLIRFKDSVRGFMFSGAGNDIIGEGKDGNAALFRLLRPFNGNPADVNGHIDYPKLGETLAKLRVAYQHVVASIRRTPGLETLPIFVHGYDYLFPYPWKGGQDKRNPRYAKNDEWLGQPFSKRGIHDDALRRNIVIILIDALYDMLQDVAAASEVTGVWVVNCRGAMPNVEDWNDEIHGTDEGFKSVAARFRATINAVLLNP